MKNYTCDVLVVGGGGGGLKAAIAAKEQKAHAKVLLAVKGLLGRSGVTATACSDRMAFHATLAHTPPGGEGNWRFHAEDIYRIGGKVSDWDLAEVLARNSAEAFDYLDKIGVPFVKVGGVPKQFMTDGSQHPRACYTGPKTAVHIEEKLANRFQELGLAVLENCMVAKLLTNGQRVIGALAVDTREKERPEEALITIKAKTVILATGGGGHIFKHNVYRGRMTGDGYALGFEAGAELVNMEFIQFGVASTKTKLNCSGSMLRALPRIIDDSGQEFLTDFLPRGTAWSDIYDLVFRKGASWPVSYEHDTRIIDIAVYKKMREGHRVFLDYSKNPEGLTFGELPASDLERYRDEIVTDLGEEKRQFSPLNRLKEINPDMIDWLKERGIDLNAGEKVEIAVCGQHFQGGVKIRDNGKTTVRGLFAVGEVAGGQHGANRPGGNALLDCQVFGQAAGEAAVEEAMRYEFEDLPVADLERFLKELQEYRNNHELTAGELRKQLQELVELSAGLARTTAGLKQGLDLLEKLQSTKVSLGNKSLAYALENKNLLLVSEMVMRAALLRDESRGPHLRFLNETENNPIPGNDGQWEKYIVIVPQRKGVMELEPRTPVHKNQATNR